MKIKYEPYNNNDRAEEKSASLRILLLLGQLLPTELSDRIMLGDM